MHSQTLCEVISTHCLPCVRREECRQVQSHSVRSSPQPNLLPAPTLPHLRTAPHHTTPHHTTPHHTTSHHITPHHIASHHITSHYITPRHTTSQDVPPAQRLHSLAGGTSHHITSHHITSHYITPAHRLHSLAGGSGCGLISMPSRLACATKPTNGSGGGVRRGGAPPNRSSLDSRLSTLDSRLSTLDSRLSTLDSLVPLVPLRILFSRRGLLTTQCIRRRIFYDC